MKHWDSHLARLQSTPLLDAIRELFDREASRIAPPADPIKVYIAGGAAVHFCTRTRVSADVDAEFSTRYVPGDDIVLYRSGTGEELPVYIELEAKANEALATAVGLNARMVTLNIIEAVDHVRHLRPAPGP